MQHRKRPVRIGMWDAERSRPWRWAALYLAAFFGSMALAHAGARGWL